MKRILLLFAVITMSVAAMAQKVTNQIKYTFEYDMQKYDYIKQLDYAEGVVARDGEQSITIQDKVYTILSKDQETNNESQKSLQYTVVSAGVEYVVCFMVDSNYPEELANQVIVFATEKPFDWTYYITDTLKLF